MADAKKNAVVPDDYYYYEDDVDVEWENFKNICGKLLKLLFSTAGLCVLNIAYIALGAVIFETLEKPNERAACFNGAENYDKIENASLTILLGITDRVRHGALQESNGQAIIENDYKQVLRSYSQNVLTVNHNVNKNCSMLGEPGGPAYGWSSEGSVMFAMTVTTTIGYGVVAPKTTSGRIIFIAYAMMGIPLMLLFLAIIGEVMATIFRYIYATICCCGCCLYKEKSKKDEDSVTDVKTTKVGQDDDDTQSTDSDDDDEDDDEENEEITVPLTISIFCLLLFTFFGAAIFKLWTNWSIIDAAYYCFVTYSTIGFGDLVPGSKDEVNPVSQAQMVCAGLYQVLGMAWLSMCFQLMQDELTAKFRWLSQKCNCGKKKKNKKLENGEVVEDCDDDDDEEEDEDQLTSKPATKFGVWKINERINKSMH